MKPSPAQIARWERRKALAREMHRKGHTFDEIGKALKVTRQRAHQLATGWR
jgi:DNA-directed RNA polymerase sigma subunit (sigma70/sigma32)